LCSGSSRPRSLARGGEGAPPAAPARRGRWWQRLLPWLITAACFVYLYGRLYRAAAAQGQGLGAYLIGIFEHVSWSRWLALMIPYCALFVLVDSVVVWRVIGWFNVRLRYADVLPIRASAYILSIVNEQVSKGAIAVYLSRRHGVPAWEVGSSMLFIMFCEFYYLLSWACVGALLRGAHLPQAFHRLPWVALGAAIFYVLWVLYFRGTIAPGNRLRDRQILHAFREAKPWQYATVIALRSPALLTAAFVYSRALGLFGVESSFGEMLGVLPLVFFGAATPGPMRAVAISMWVLLFPDHPAEMAAFGLVMHNFFIFFNAAIGLLFLRRANRELFASNARPE
jgi:hypothetical protein